MPENDNEPNLEIGEFVSEDVDTSSEELQEDVDAEFPFPIVPIRMDRGLQLRAYCEETFQAILTTNTHQHPTIYQKSGELSRIVKTSTGKRIIQPINKDIMYNVITYRVDYFRRPSIKEFAEYQMTHPEVVSQDAMDNIPLKPLKEIVANLVTRNSYDGLPELIGIVNCPIMDLQTGDINFHSHYDQTAQMYYGRSDLALPTIPATPTQEQVTTAVSLLKECVVDFPFVDDASKANILALILTSIIRPSIDGRVPIFLIDKPTAGTGAGLLCDTISLISTGGCATVSTISEEEEWKKVTLSILKSGKLLSIIDNVEGKVDLPTLAAIVTSDIYSDRALGSNTLFESPNRLIWVLNGNNVMLGGDLPRRVAWIRMDSKLEHPWLRSQHSFVHPNQIQWITENRGNILSAVFTIVRSWIQSGKTSAGCDIVPMGGFENWRDIVGGILQHMGITGFLNNSKELLDSVDVDAPQWNTFVSTLFERLADWDKKSKRMLGSAFSLLPTTTEVEFTTQTVLDIIDYEKDPIHVGDRISLHDALPDRLADEYGTMKNFNKVFGRSMLRNKDKVFGGKYNLGRSEKKRDNKVIWKIIRVPETTTYS